MKTLSLSYNQYTGQYILIDNPDPSSSKGRSEFSDLKDIVDILNPILKEHGKKVRINVDLKAEQEEELRRNIPQKYSARIILDKA